MTTANVETITPAQAQVLLLNNGINRKLRKHRVAMYAHQMTNGQWQMTGEAICISATGRLLNGVDAHSAFGRRSP